MQRKFLLGILAMTFFLLSCGQTGEKGIGPSATPFIGGTNALSASFTPGAPPDYIFDRGGFPFGISLNIQNLGEDDVNPGDGYVEIIGVNPRDFGLASQADLRRDFVDPLLGARKNFAGDVIEGGRTVMSFGDIVPLNYQPDLTGNFPLTLRANLCYNYKTIASSQVCVKRDLLTNIDTKEICEITGDKLISNSGGPLQVISLSEAPVGDNKIQVNFIVAHVGAQNDRFYRKDTSCDDRTTNANKDVVFVNMVSDINGARAQCSGLQNPAPDRSSGFITLFNGAPRNVVCTFDTATVDFVSQMPVLIELEYRYSQFIEKPLIVQDVATG
ncbi:MAG TPA: hypothetical protein VJK52_03860 [Candidatus Nanoarchaeia archaeon]|nr:hypothetical protein [Candidatus Nanoarchaeia archaeon]